jgi:hypothetical protein
MRNDIFIRAFDDKIDELLCQPTYQEDIEAFNEAVTYL